MKPMLINADDVAIVNCGKFKSIRVKRTELFWIPGYERQTRNETADDLARSGSKLIVDLADNSIDIFLHGK